MDPSGITLGMLVVLASVGAMLVKYVLSGEAVWVGCIFMSALNVSNEKSIPSALDGVKVPMQSWPTAHSLENPHVKRYKVNSKTKRKKMLSGLLATLPAGN